MSSERTTPASLGLRVLAHIFLRCYLVGANFNTRGMQNVGLAICLEPGLRILHPDVTSRQKARRRSLQHYNTHPYWTPLLVGIFLSIERDIARGLLPPLMLQRVKSTTTYTLSALGDSFFGGALLVFCMLVLVLAVINSVMALAWIWLGICFLALQAFKVYTFVGGAREGISFLNRLKKWNLINWGQRIKLINAGLLVLIWMQLWPELGKGWEWGAWTLALLLAAAACICLRLSRFWLVLAFIGYWGAWLWM